MREINTIIAFWDNDVVWTRSYTDRKQAIEFIRQSMEHDKEDGISGHMRYEILSASLFN